MKALVCPNPFKGTLSAAQAAKAIATGLRRAGWQALELPLADGGPGSLDAAKHAMGGRLRRLRVAGPLGRPVRAAWLDLGPGRAFIESAQAIGLTLLPASKHRPLQASTEGLGQLLLGAKAQGAKELWIGLGGSATTDGGTGLARALGWRFFDTQGQELPPGGGSLLDLHSVLPPKRSPLKGLRLRVLCDVTNPLFGPRGAAQIFAPQKGATAAQVQRLDRGLRRLSTRLKASAIARRPGSGAAGGLGFGLQAFAGATLVPGAEALLKLADFHRHLGEADVVVTGEGCLDSQSLAGKLPTVVAAAAKKARRPCVAFCGRSSLSALQAAKAGLAAVIEAPGKENAAKVLETAAAEWASELGGR